MKKFEFKRLCLHFSGIICAAAFLFSQPSLAVRFANQFIEFELPTKWQCNLEGAEWVCQSTDETKKKDAIIIMAAKIKGDQDSLNQYLDYLQKPKDYTSVKGQPVRSVPKHAKYAQLNNHSWVDSLHLESEIPGFYTRYLATVKNDIAVLVTYSVNKDKYSEYLEEFETMVKTLKVFRKAGPLNPSGGGPTGIQIPTGVSPGSVFPGGGMDDPFIANAKKSGDDDFMFYAALIGGAVAFIIWRRRKSKTDFRKRR